MRLAKLTRLLVLFLLLQPAANLIAEPSAARAVVDKLHTALLAAMKKANELGYSGRYKALEPVIGNIFDFPTIAKIVVGRYWKDLDNNQRSLFIDTFTRLSTATYASRFDGFSGEEFQHVSNVALNNKRMLIKTKLVKSDGEAVQLDYVLQEEAGGWLIVNIIANGVSDLSLKRADYTTILKTQGLDALIAMLNKKIAQYEKPGEK